MSWRKRSFWSLVIFCLIWAAWHFEIIKPHEEIPAPSFYNGCYGHLAGNIVRIDDGYFYAEGHSDRIEMGVDKRGRYFLLENMGIEIKRRSNSAVISLDGHRRYKFRVHEDGGGFDILASDGRKIAVRRRECEIPDIGPGQHPETS